MNNILLRGIICIAFLLMLGCEDSAKQPATGGGNPNDPVVSVTLVTDPSESVIFINSTVTFSWYATTAQGNRITDIPGTLTLEPTVSPVSNGSNQYRFANLGTYVASIDISSGSNSFRDTKTITVTDMAPKVELTYPQRGQTVLATNGSLILIGQTENTSSLTVNGQAVTLDESGAFEHAYTPNWGVNMLKFEASGAGITRSSSPTFLYAQRYTAALDERGAGVNLADSLLATLAASFFDDGVHNPNDIDDLATVAEVIIQDSDLTAALQETGALESLATEQDFGVVPILGQTTLKIETNFVSPTSVGPAQVTLTPVEGGLAFQVVVGNNSKPALTIRLRVDLTFEFVTAQGTGRATGSIFPTVTVGLAALEGTLFIDKQPGNMVTANLEDFELSIENVMTDPIEDVELSLDILGAMSTIDLSNIISIDTFSSMYIDPVVNRAITFLTDNIEPLVAGASQTLLVELFDNLNLSDTITFDNIFDPTRDSITLLYETDLNRFTFSNDGALIGLNVGVFTPPAIPRNNDGAIQRTDCLRNLPSDFVPNWNTDIGFALAGDAINGLLYGIWQSGLITGPINLTEILGENSFLTGQSFSVVLDPYAPPILDACREELGATLRIGDLRLELAGELLGIQLDSTVFADLDVKAIYKATQDGIFLEIGEVLSFDVEVVEVGPNAIEGRVRPFLEEQLGVIINGLLVGQGVGPLPLPSINFSDLSENINAQDTLDVVPSGVRTENGRIVVEANLD